MNLSRYMHSRYIPIIIVLLITARLLLIHFNAPWFGHHDANGVWLSAASRNARVYDSLEHPLIPLINLGPVPPEAPRWYIHHPPLIVWSITTAHQIFGDYPLAARFISISSTLISIAAFFVFCRRLYNPQRALLCTALFTFTPMIVFFGRMPNHEPMSLAFLFISLAILLNWMRKPTHNRWRLMVLVIFLAIWTAWAPAFFYGVIVVLCWNVIAPHLRFRLFMVGLVAVLSVISVMAFYQIIYSETGPELIRTFLWRTSTVSEITEDFSMLEFVGVQTLHLIAYGSFALFILSIAGIIPITRFETPLNRRIIFAFGIAGVAYISLFRSASYVHDYYKIYLIPFMALSAANAIVYSLKNQTLRRFAHPALVALFATSTVFAIAYLTTRYTADFATATIELAQEIAANSDQTDVVLINLETASPIIEYYAFRDITWSVGPSEIDQYINELDHTLVYAHCLSENDIISLHNTMNVTDQEIVVTDKCQFVRIR